MSGYTGGGKELIEVHEKTPGVEPFGLYGVELAHKHVPEMKKYSHIETRRCSCRCGRSPTVAA